VAGENLTGVLPPYALCGNTRLSINQNINAKDSSIIPQFKDPNHN